MKFLIDAQLPRRAVAWLAVAGHQATHTLELPDRNRTPDDTVATLADRDEQVVVTKDSDFVDSHLLHGRPAKLLLISAGNLTNAELQSLMVPAIPAIVGALTTNDFVELGWSGIIVRG